MEQKTGEDGQPEVPEDPETSADPEADEASTESGSKWADYAAKTRHEKAEWWTELLAVIILTVATVGASWSGYQSARWGGVQSTSYTEAGGKRVESTRAAAKANAQITIDVSVFTSWLNAYAQDQMELADFYAARFRDEFKVAFDEWVKARPRLNPDAPATPFATPEYRLASQEQADQLEEEANALLQKGKDANQQSDDYVLNTVFLVSVLFFGGVAQRFKRLYARMILITLGVIMLVYGLINIATYPVY